MRNKLFILIALFVVAISVIAQQSKQKKWKAPKRPKVKWVAPKREEQEDDVIDMWRPYNISDNWFVELYGGTSMMNTENSKGRSLADRVTALGSFAIGRQTSYLFSTRLAFEYARQSGWAAAKGMDLHPQMGDGKYLFKRVDVFLDEKFSFVNAIGGYRTKRRFDMLMFVGLGVDYSWDIDKKVDKWQEYDESFMINRSDQINLGLRGGLEMMYRITPAVDISLQGTYNMLGDGYNGMKHSNSFAFDSGVELMLGVTMHLMDHYGDYRYKKLNRQHALMLRGQNRKVDKYLHKEKSDSLKLRRESEVVEFGKLMKTTVMFYIDRTYINDEQVENVRIVAEFLKEHPEVNLIVRAYSGASVRGESPNMHLAERRAEAVKKCLTRFFNVDESRFTVWFDENAQPPYPMRGEWIDGVVFEMVEK